MFEEFEAPRFEYNLHMKVVSLSDVSTSHLYPPGNITGTHFCYRSGSSVGIVTDYGLDGPGSNASEDEIFRHPDQPWGTPASCKMGTGPFLGIKCGRGVLLTTHPLSSGAVMEE